MNIVIPKMQQAFVLIYVDDNDDSLFIGIVGEPFEGRVQDMQKHPERKPDRYHVQELFSSEWVKLSRGRELCSAG